MMLLFVIVFGLQLMRGNKHYNSIIGVEACSATDFALLAFLFLVCIIGLNLIVKDVRKRHQLKISLGY